MRIALQNIHLLPNIFDVGIHDYMLNLLKNGYANVLYFSDHNSPIRSLKLFRRYLMNRKYSGIDWKNIEFVFTGKGLNRKADILLNLNTMYMPNLDSEFTTALRKFNGLKIFHVGDYFWNHPGSELNNYLVKYGADHLFGYAMHDRYCSYFQKTFPTYKNKVWGIPFGFGPRFIKKTRFENRINKAVALGSVNPLRPLAEPVANYRETADFFPDDNWFHKFRRLLVLNKESLRDEADNMLPEFPAIKDFKYDIVEKFNMYKMFVTCESIFFFPVAKVFEGPACGTTLIAADHECIKEYGFRDKMNCIMYQLYNIEDFKGKVQYYQLHPEELAQISENGMIFVRENYSHDKVSKIIMDTINLIWNKGSNAEATPVAERLARVRQ